MDVGAWWHKQPKWDKCYTIGGLTFLLGLAIFVVNVKSEEGISYSIPFMVCGLAIFVVGRLIEKKSNVVQPSR